ncbi:MAG: hypothetical protein CL610_13740 [Anaerolineaceae bacterium]|nr:hypothetical protein [Anaerolineaceae bacterium]
MLETVSNMDLPSHLRALPPAALEVLRYLNTVELHMAGIDDICDAAGLSERGFGKAIRSLVTKGYVVMDGNQVYRLTEQGSNVADELAEYGFGDDEDDDIDADAMAATDEQADEPATLKRHLVLVMPPRLTALQPTHVVVGFAPASEPTAPAEIVARLSVLNGEPSAPQEASFELDEAAATQDFLITPGAYTQTRVRVEVFQLGPNPDDVATAGGLYVDVDVSTDTDPVEPVAFGTDVTITPQE